MYRFKHYKTGATYEVITDSALIVATNRRAVVYRQDAGPGLVNANQMWIRPFSEFHSLVEVEGGSFVPRFAPMTEYPTRD